MFFEASEPTQEELIEARERADAGHRLVLPQLFDRTDESGVPEPLNAEMASRVCAWLTDARAAVHTSALQIPLEGEELLHAELNALVTKLDDISAGLAGRRFES